MDIFIFYTSRVISYLEPFYLHSCDKLYWNVWAIHRIPVDFFLSRLLVFTFFCSVVFFSRSFVRSRSAFYHFYTLRYTAVEKFDPWSTSTFWLILRGTLLVLRVLTLLYHDLLPPFKSKNVLSRECYWKLFWKKIWTYDNPQEVVTSTRFWRCRILTS